AHPVILGRPGHVVGRVARLIRRHEPDGRPRGIPQGATWSAGGALMVTGPFQLENVRSVVTFPPSANPRTAVRPASRFVSRSTRNVRSRLAPGRSSGTGTGRALGIGTLSLPPLRAFSSSGVNWIVTVAHDLPPQSTSAPLAGSTPG